MFTKPKWNCIFLAIVQEHILETLFGENYSSFIAMKGGVGATSTTLLVLFLEVLLY